MTLLSLEHFIPVIEPFLGKRIGYVRLPGNFGDQMIEMGAIQLFGLMGIDWYIEDFSGACAADELVIAGGGNMGPLYGACLSIRRKALELGKPITVLPQSFNGPEDLGYHRIYVRERESLRYRPDALLAPDLALALAWERRSLSEPTDTLGVWLRKDREALYAERSQGDPVKCCKSVKEYLDLAGKYRHLVTDRLHFAIAGLIQGRDVTLLPNSYHKNRSMWETWLRELGCKWQDCPDSFLSPTTVSPRERGDAFEGGTSVAEAPMDAARAAGSSGVLQIMIRNLRDEASALRDAHMDKEREVRELKARFAERDAQAMINSAGAEIAAMKGQLMATQAELSALRRQKETMAQDLTEARGHRDRAEEMIRGLRQELACCNQEMHSLLSKHCVSEAAATDEAFSSRVAYWQLVRRFREALKNCVSADRNVLVISEGDEDLLTFDGRRGWHFPQDEKGLYPGSYPASSAAAVAHLESLRGMGAHYLALPVTAIWWLEQWVAFKAHLERNYRLIHRSDDTCLIFALCESSPWREVTQLIADFKARHRRCPAILNWESGVDLANTFPECAVFAPMDAGNDQLPYLTESIDIIAVGTCEPKRLAEARRVASEAVFIASPAAGNSSEPEFVIERHSNSQPSVR